MESKTEIKNDVRNKKKLFSIRYKLLLIFGVLIVITVTSLNFVSLRIAKVTVMDSVEAHLIDEAEGVARTIEQAILIGLGPFVYSDLKGRLMGVGHTYFRYRLTLKRGGVTTVKVDSVFIKSLETYRDTIYY